LFKCIAAFEYPPHRLVVWQAHIDVVLHRLQTQIAVDVSLGASNPSKIKSNAALG
jgi:hypothetical protein